MTSGVEMVESLVTLRPRLYHLTAASNITSIMDEGVLHPATHLLRAAGESQLGRQKRAEHATILVAGRAVQLRDQAPLHAGNMALDDGWTLADFVAHLNQHVFFWPGNASRPSDYGRRHFQRYRHEHNAVLVLDTRRVIAANASPGVRLCRYNSGSPRCNGGKPSPRGKRTFLPPGQFEAPASAVVEVTFAGSVRLADAVIAVSTADHFV